MTAHSVEQHLRVTVAGYDRAIRVLVPHYDELIATGVELLAALAPARARVLDLGGGTGGLTAAIVAGLPEATVTLLDIDPQMLEQARARLASGPVDFVHGSFFDPLPARDAVVASLSLHHIHDLDAKTRVYAAIFASLPTGGVFLNLDATVSADPRLAALTFTAWARAMAAHGVDEATARGHFADWEREDRYFSLHEELAALARAGFPQPECFWRRGPVAIYGGLKP